MVSGQQPHTQHGQDKGDDSGQEGGEETSAATAHPGASSGEGDQLQVLLGVQGVSEDLTGIDNTTGQEGSTAAVLSEEAEEVRYVE